MGYLLQSRNGQMKKYISYYFVKLIISIVLLSSFSFSVNARLVDPESIITAIDALTASTTATVTDLRRADMFESLEKSRLDFSEGISILVEQPAAAKVLLLRSLEEVEHYSDQLQDLVDDYQPDQYSGVAPNIAAPLFSQSNIIQQRLNSFINGEPDPLFPSVIITSPDSLITVGSTPISVTGTINRPNATLSVNGIPVTPANGQFQVSVALQEGLNNIVARLIDANGDEVTDSIVVSMDLTPPYVTIETPVDLQTLGIPSIAVSGLVNDIVRGTVSANQANVSVNGVIATVANRSYLAENVPLVPGDNIIRVSAADQVGNVGNAEITVRFDPLTGQQIQLVSGQNQRAQIRSALPLPLAVKLIDANNLPVANKNVIFRVAQGDGLLGVGTVDEAQGILVATDATGVAQTTYQVGSRAGNGNQRVRATAVGFNGEVLFYASSDPKPGNKVSINSGNNQRGAVNQLLPQPFVVAVTDEGANVVAGTQVKFEVTTGGGVFQNGLNAFIATTDSDGRATAHLTLGPNSGLDNNRVTAIPVGTTLTAGFTASGLLPGDPGNTSVSGVVFDNQDTPLPGVSVRVEGTTRQAQSDAAGQFIINNVPVGPLHLIVDGETTTVPGEWPTLSYNLVTVAGVENILPAPIYMVKLNTANAVMVGAQDAVITLDELPGFKLEVAAGSVTFPDGSRSGLLSVTPVNSSKVPMPPPNGMQPQVIVTIQPTNTRFDPPAKLTLPNVDGHAPGAQVEMYSFDHDLEEFVAIGLGTVSVDGSLVSSNPGIGVIKAGWHCGSQPGGQGCASNPGECQKCDGNCNIVSDNSKTPTSISDTAGDCKKPECSGGSATQGNDDLDKPNDICKDCNNGSVLSIQDGQKATDNNSCCFAGVPQQNNPIIDLNKCPNRIANPAHTPGSNGCGGEGLSSAVPDNPMFVTHFTDLVYRLLHGPSDGDFTQACNGHDICYDTCNSNKGGCDTGFRDSMDVVCINDYDTGGLLDTGYLVQCLAFSSTYESVVSAIDSFYESAQKNACNCC